LKGQEDFNNRPKTFRAFFQKGVENNSVNTKFQESPLLDAYREAPPPGFVFRRPPCRVWESLLVLTGFSVSQPVISLAASTIVASFLPIHMGFKEFERQLVLYTLPATIFISHALGWALIWLAVSWRGGWPMLRGVGLGPPGWGETPPVRSAARFNPEWLWWFAGGMVMHFFSLLAIRFIENSSRLDSPLSKFVQSGPVAVALLVLMAVIMAPLLEEVIFRGLLFGSLRLKMGFWPAGLVSAGMFSGVHFLQTQGYLPALVVIILLGLLLAWVKELSRSLWPAVLFHAGFNMMALLPIILGF